MILEFKTNNNKYRRASFSYSKHIFSSSILHKSYLKKFITSLIEKKKVVKSRAFSAEKDSHFRGFIKLK